VPAACLALAAGAVLVPESRHPAAPPLDVPGMLLSAGAVTCLVWGVIDGPEHGWTAPSVWALLTGVPPHPGRPAPRLPPQAPGRRARRPGPATAAGDPRTRLPGSSNLLARYLNQGRLDNDRPHLSPRRAARILLTRPDRLTAGQHETLAGLTAACPEMTALAGLITSFAALLVPGPGNDARLRRWTTGARAADLPHPHSFTRGLDLDIQAATAALTLPHYNGRTEGVNTKTKMIKRQMYGRAGFTLLRHRILLG
jgi:hypothetical protein